MENKTKQQRMLEELFTKHCAGCGSQRCDSSSEEWRAGCPHWQEILNDNKDILHEQR